MNPDILIVVAALDEADRISSTLAALADAFPGAPIWVADDGSRDATPELARTAGATVVRSERVIGKGQAMSAGMRAALESIDFLPSNARAQPTPIWWTLWWTHRRASLPTDRPQIRRRPSPCSSSVTETLATARAS